MRFKMAQLIKIGNSQGIRIPKSLIDQAGLDKKELVLKIVDKGILIQPAITPRKGWKDVFEKGANSGDSIDVEWIEAPLVDDDGDFEW
jgi:antitoxin MazE